MGQYVENTDWLWSETGYRKRTYSAYQPHCLFGWEPVLSVDTWHHVNAASDAIKSYKAVAQDVMILEVAQWLLAREESINSNKIEGVRASEQGFAWGQYKFFYDRSDLDEQDAFALGSARQNESALELGTKLAQGQTCSVKDIQAIHALLFAGTQEEDTGGVIRDSPIWIGAPGCLIEQATFVPPPSNAVARLMEDLVHYLNYSNHHPVVKAAIAHAQFETIHPFDDGNGRTGRALIQSVLKSADYINHALPISAALNNARQNYYFALQRFRVLCAADDHIARSEAMRPWLEVFAQASKKAVVLSSSLQRQAEEIVSTWKRNTRFRANSIAGKALAVLSSTPILDAPLLANKLGVSTRSARTALNKLESAGIIENAGGERHRRFIVPELVYPLLGRTPLHRFATRRAQQSDDANSNNQQSSFPAPTLCGYYGPISRKHCILAQGHRGNHRYS